MPGLSFVAEQAAAEAAAGGNGGEGDEEGGAGPNSAPALTPFVFPTSLIKKIACMDPDVDRMAADATRALSKATALFVELLATKALNHATHLKRKNFKFSDIEAVGKKDRRMVDMGLPEMFEKDKAFEEVRNRVAQEGQSRKIGKKAGAEGADGEEQQQKKMRPLTDFFKAGGSGSAAAVVEDADEEEDAAAEIIEIDNEEEEEENILEQEEEEELEDDGDGEAADEEELGDDTD